MYINFTFAPPMHLVFSRIPMWFSNLKFAIFFNSAIVVKKNPVVCFIISPRDDMQKTKDTILRMAD